MTQDDKPQGLMSAEALAEVQARHAKLADYIDNQENDLVLDGYWLSVARTYIPRLLAHIAAQDARIAELRAELELVSYHAADDWPDPEKNDPNE